MNSSREIHVSSYHRQKDKRTISRTGRQFELESPFMNIGSNIINSPFLKKMYIYSRQKSVNFHINTILPGLTEIFYEDLFFIKEIFKDGEY